MEKCFEDSKIDNISYQRIRDLVCQKEQAYLGEIKERVNINSSWLLILIILIISIKVLSICLKKDASSF